MIEAVYEDGVLKPLKKLRIKEREKLTLTITRKQPRTKREKAGMSLVGIFNSGLHDLSKDHDKYLYGWKKAR